LGWNWRVDGCRLHEDIPLRNLSFSRLHRLLLLFRQLRSNDSLRIHIEILVNAFSVHVKPLSISVKAFSLQVTPVDAIKIERLWFTTNFLELAMQSVGAESSFSLPAEVGVHVQGIVATKARQRPFARFTLEDKQILNRLSGSALAGRILGESSILPCSTVVLGIGVVADWLLRAVLYVCIWVEPEIIAEFFGSSFVVFQIRQGLSINVV
jgi:hypothetical protein